RSPEPCGLPDCRRQDVWPRPRLLRSLLEALPRGRSVAAAAAAPPRPARGADRLRAPRDAPERELLVAAARRSARVHRVIALALVLLAGRGEGAGAPPMPPPRPSLIAAIRANDLARVQKALDLGANPNGNERPDKPQSLWTF